MNRSIFYALLGCICISIFVVYLNKVYAMTKLNAQNLDIEGPWLQYVPNGEYGPSMELYDFLPDQTYRIVITIIPEKESDILPVVYKILGSYTLQGKTLTIKPKYDGEEIIRTIRIENNLLVIVNEESGEMLTLQRVRDQF